MQYVVVPLEKLKRRLGFLHPNVKRLQTYLWITADNECCETRGLKKKHTNSIISRNNNESDKGIRNFTQFLNNWTAIIEKLT